MQGEVLAFYLARMLGITNVPVVALSKVGIRSSTHSSFRVMDTYVFKGKIKHV